MSTQSPNVLLLLSDEHSFRYRGGLDGATGEPVRTPTLDGLANAGMSFETAYCPSPLCTPSRLCMLTGREVYRCGAWDNAVPLDPALPTLPGTLSASGYETALFGKMHLGGPRQFAGFDHRPYGDLHGANSHQPDPIDPSRRHPEHVVSLLADAGVTEIPESQLQERIVAREALSFLREHRHAHPETPWFCCASFSRPHFPLTAPRRHVDRYWDVDADEPRDRLTDPKVGRNGDTADHPLTVHRARRLRLADDPEAGTAAVDETTKRRARAGYFACVDFLDEVIGEFLDLLDAAGFLDDTVVVYTSDHGELAGEHGLFWKHTWHEAAARVPWIVSLPEHRDGTRASGPVSTPVSLIDLFPTLCGLADAPIPDDIDGHDLSTTVRTGAEPDRGPVYCDLFGGERSGAGGPPLDFRMVREGRFKYVRFADAPELLVDVAADPLEQTNLARNVEEQDATVRDAYDRLTGLVDEAIDFEEIGARRERSFEEAAADLDLDAAGHNNAYLLPDGRLVSAETTLYDPVVLAETPGDRFADWPDSR